MRLGSRGLREVDGRGEKVEDAGLAAALRARATAIVLRALLLAAAVTVAVWVVARLVRP